MVRKIFSATDLPATFDIDVNVFVPVAEAGRVFDVLDTRPELTERENAVALPPAGGDVRFEGVSFSYGGDATVPLWSAVLPGAQMYYVNEKHRYLPGNDKVIAGVLELLLWDGDSPRSLLYQLKTARRHLAELTGEAGADPGPGRDAPGADIVPDTGT